MKNGKYEIYCKPNNDFEMYWCKTIYQKWDEDDIPFKRRAKREFKKYIEKHQNEIRKFYLIKEE